YRGSYSEAIEWLRRGLEVAQAFDVRLDIYLFMCLFHDLLGELHEVVAIGNTLLDMVGDNHDDRARVGEGFAERGHYLFRTDRFDAAEAYYQVAVRFDREYKELYDLAKLFNGAARESQRFFDDPDMHSSVKEIASVCFHFAKIS